MDCERTYKANCKGGGVPPGFAKSAWERHAPTAAANFIAFILAAYGQRGVLFVHLLPTTQPEPMGALAEGQILEVVANLCETQASDYNAWNGATDEYISISKGQAVYNLCTDGLSRLEARIEDGVQGWVPANYCE